MTDDAMGAAVTRRWTLVHVLGVVGAVALAIRVIGIGSDAIDHDELWTLHVAELSWWGLVENRIGAGHSPLYFALNKLLFTGSTDIALVRLPNAFLDTAACMVLTTAVARHAGLTAAMLTGFAYATMPMLVEWAQHARPYPLMMLGLMTGMSGIMGFIAAVGTQDGAGLTDATRRYRVMMASGLSLATLSLTGGMMAAVLLLFTPVLVGALRRQTAIRMWLIASIPVVASAGCVILIITAPTVSNPGAYWLEVVRGLDVRNVLNFLYAATIGDALTSSVRPIAAIGLTICSVLLLGTIALHGVRAALTRPAFAPVFILVVAFAGLLIAISIEKSLLKGRYFLPAFAGMAVLLGLGLGQMIEAGRRLMPGIVLVVMFTVGTYQSVYPQADEPLHYEWAGDLIHQATDYDRPRIIITEHNGWAVYLRKALMIRHDDRGLHPSFISGRMLAHGPRKDPVTEGNIQVFLVSDAKDYDDYTDTPGAPAVCRWEGEGSVLTFHGINPPADCPAP